MLGRAVSTYAAVAAHITKSKVRKLPTSPLTLPCPFCKARPGDDCATSAGGFAAIHVRRIKAAADIDTIKRDKLSHC
jgi:hypothetical protein